ncbi:MAG TPA: hypothetical protein VFI23_05160 [Rhizomicrobium sp.]|nr:hypothetical protein [Rhizomicrobium sp.]
MRNAIRTLEHGDLSNAIAGLEQRRADIINVINKIKSDMRDAVIQLDHVEATMRIFDPHIDFRAMGGRKVLPVDPAQHGENMRIVLAALVDAGRPLSTAALIEQIIQVRALDRTDSSLRRIVAKRLGPSLRYTEHVRGLIRSSPGPGQMKMWELVK